MRNLTRLLTTAAAATLIATLGGFATAPAHAATPTCKSLRLITSLPKDYQVWVPAVSDTNRSTVCLLKRGSTGVAVEYLQSSMNEIYDFNLAVDGDFGGATERALISLQRQLGIKADGIYGTQTRDAICWPTAYGSGCWWWNQ